jgi:hypothetical protein
VSKLFAYGTITTKGQNRLNLSTNYWTPQNKYHFTAGINYINFPFDFYGIGNNTNKANADRLGQKRLRLTLTGEKRIGSNVYVGFVAGGFHYAFDDQVTDGIYQTDPTIEGRMGGSTVYLGPSFIFDNRNNNTYTTKGLVFNASFQALKGIGRNSDYNGGLFDIEYAQFFSLAKRLVLGVNAQSQNLTGSQSPFYFLPAMGNDEIMRGYYNGRFRDRNLLVAQTELRYRLSDRFGVVGFLGTGEVFKNSFSFGQLKPNYGGGMRYFFDIEKGLSIRADYGIGQQRPGETRQSGFYVGLGEAF